jgi:hypothetical protein
MAKVPGLLIAVVPGFYFLFSDLFFLKIKQNGGEMILLDPIILNATFPY